MWVGGTVGVQVNGRQSSMWVVSGRPGNRVRTQCPMGGRFTDFRCGCKIQCRPNGGVHTSLGPLSTTNGVTLLILRIGPNHSTCIQSVTVNQPEPGLIFSHHNAPVQVCALCARLQRLPPPQIGGINMRPSHRPSIKAAPHSDRGGSGDVRGGVRGGGQQRRGPGEGWGCFLRFGPTERAVLCHFHTEPCRKRRFDCHVPVAFSQPRNNAREGRGNVVPEIVKSPIKSLVPHHSRRSVCWLRSCTPCPLLARTLNPAPTIDPPPSSGTLNPLTSAAWIRPASALGSQSAAARRWRRVQLFLHAARSTTSRTVRTTPCCCNRPRGCCVSHNTSISPRIAELHLMYMINSCVFAAADLHHTQLQWLVHKDRHTAHPRSGSSSH